MIMKMMWHSLIVQIVLTNWMKIITAIIQQNLNCDWNFINTVILLINGKDNIIWELNQETGSNSIKKYEHFDVVQSFWATK